MYIYTYVYIYIYIYIYIYHNLYSLHEVDVKVSYLFISYLIDSLMVFERDYQY